MCRFVFILIILLIGIGCKENLTPLENTKTRGLQLEGDYNSKVFQYRDTEPVISVIIDTSKNRIEGLYIADVSFFELLKNESFDYMFIIEMDYKFETNTIEKLGQKVSFTRVNQPLFLQFNRESSRIELQEFNLSDSTLILDAQLDVIGYADAVSVYGRPEPDLSDCSGELRGTVEAKFIPYFLP